MVTFIYVRNVHNQLTAINLNLVRSIAKEGKRVTFEFGRNDAIPIDCESDAEADDLFRKAIHAPSSDAQ